MTAAQSSHGAADLLILRTIGTQEMHGSELTQALRRFKLCWLNFGEGQIYPVLHRLEQQGYLRSRPRAVPGPLRICYSLTRKARRRIQAPSACLDRISAALRAIAVEGSAHAPAV